MNYGIDHPFILTTKNNGVRLSATMQHLSSVGVTPTVFQGIDATQAGLHTIHTYDVDHPGSNYHIGPASIGACLTHFMAWKTFEYLDGDYFVAFEDDVRLASDWRSHFDTCFTRLPSDWDLFYLGSCCTKTSHHVMDRLWRVSYAGCLHATAIRKKALPVLLTGLDKIWAPIDLFVALQAIPRLHVYAILPRIAEQASTKLPT